MTPSITNEKNLDHGMKLFTADREIKPIDIKTLPFCEIPFATLHF